MLKIQYVAALLTLLVSQVQAADCDFDKPIGTCTAQISIDRTGGSKPSYSAEITVTSSAQTCSKAEYFVDSTPYTTVLRASNSEGESLFGTRPISRKSIAVKGCTAYEDRQSSASAGADCKAAETQLKTNIGKLENTVTDTQMKLNMAKKNRNDEMNDGDPDRNYVKEMDKFLATYTPALNAQQELLAKAQACLNNKKCLCGN